MIEDQHQQESKKMNKKQEIMNDSSISVDELAPRTSYCINSSSSCCLDFCFLFFFSLFKFKVSFTAFNDMLPNATSLIVIAVAFLC